MKRLFKFAGIVTCVVAFGLNLFNSLNYYWIKGYDSLHIAILANGSGSGSNGGGTGGSDENRWEIWDKTTKDETTGPYPKGDKVCYVRVIEWTRMCFDRGNSPCLEGHYDSTAEVCYKPF